MIAQNVYVAHRLIKSFNSKQKFGILEKTNLILLMLDLLLDKVNYFHF